MRVEIRDTLEWLYTDSTVGPRPRLSAKLDVARGGTAAVHLLLTELEAGSTLRVSLRRSGRPDRSAQWFRLVDVPVEENTGTDGFVEPKGRRNKWVTRRAPFRVFDAMEPVKGRVAVQSTVTVLRLHIPVPADARPGRRAYTIEISAGGVQKQLRLAVNVHRAAVPPVGSASWPYTNWFSYQLIAERHGLKPWSEAHWRMLRKYAALMVRCRQNMFWLPFMDVFKRTRRGLVLNRDRLRRIVKTFTSAGMHLIEGGHFASRSGGEWQAATFDITLGGPRATSVKGNADMAFAAEQLMSEIDRNGWRARWIQHVADEPVAANAADYRIMVGMVHKYMPGIPILDATMDPALAGSVNIWCPQCHEFQRHRKEFEAQRALGDAVWFYTCCVPGGPWLNRLMDMELIRPALLGWAGALFDLQGFLHWGLNHYRPEQDPFKESVVKHGGHSKLPAGDTHVVYPGADGPWSSVRFEAQREGIEDLELLRMLKARNPKAASEIIRSVVTGFDKYTRDVGKLRAARTRLLRALAR